MRQWPDTRECDPVLLQLGLHLVVSVKSPWEAWDHGGYCDKAIPLLWHGSGVLDEFYMSLIVSGTYWG